MISLYQRIRIDAESVFILDNKDISPREFPGIVEDISESGVKIVTSKDESSHILNYLSSGKIFTLMWLIIISFLVKRQMPLFPGL